MFLGQDFGDLHRIQRRTLAEVVGDHPEGEAVLHGRVLADAADEHVILAGAFVRRHIAFVGAVVDHRHTRRGAQSGAGLLDVAADPENPVIKGAWTTRYVHECQVVLHQSGPYAGQEIAYLFAAGPYYGYDKAFATARIAKEKLEQSASR